MELNLQGRRALVTGSSSGIGVAVAQLLAAEGARVAVHGRDGPRAEAVAARIRAGGNEAIVALGDLQEDTGAAAVADAVGAAFGGIDILVNNAGGSADLGGSVDWFGTPVEQWGSTYQKNVGAAARMIKAFVPGMRERGWGRVISISSVAARGGSGSMPDYGAAKGALNAMGFNLARALARTGITVNTLSLGLIRTEALEQWLDGVSQRHEVPRAETPAWVSRHMFDQAVERLGEVSDVAGMVAYLASPYGDFITGANITIDGGIK